MPWWCCHRSSAAGNVCPAFSSGACAWGVAGGQHLVSRGAVMLCVQGGRQVGGATGPTEVIKSVLDTARTGAKEEIFVDIGGWGHWEG